ncbi:uncharacterized protein MELLADRAFT_73335 [Melampsora larici-populina 98AG31]|uniref:Uncharacterized protein n=1 Tax=Melampsora larici-populina (strain 98AG31 / pathotype 3-4-7) TaxID=747676 RepID=F4S6N1_MELLP|nr:uncharacterized protein MELLADRAFT_73335 [Melampsora larici-populina 98AG31]EGF99731.1 hypothetical protein MELLADRAFT_73335 [Melampsora larici-populina 98AG31]
MVEERPKELIKPNNVKEETQTNTNTTTTTTTKKKKINEGYQTNHRKLWIGPGEGCSVSLGKLKKLIHSVKFLVRISASVHPNSNKKEKTSDRSSKGLNPNDTGKKNRENLT